ncbi:amidohydrolase family protein [Tepidamorphus gemmatus]|jgi:hypothetical protein|uniref:Amidohydrolase family protein n=1 Tax=Tepidamorphus gemmatus TaxID=747076 RepID=A0A4V2UYY3_9HYPH|nr:DUF6282 family protein [Tepidamorphus gemmatus]TCT09188.1 amidohydrolase family protein [Tepidamorphus gemmatus]
MSAATLDARSRDEQVSALLKGAVDLHVHSGPSAMPRILDHEEAQAQADAAGFRAILYKDHFYPGMAHAQMLEKAYPDRKVRLFSGTALNNATGGVNRYAVDLCVKLGGKIVWMPTFSAKNHIDKYAAKNKQAMAFPSTREKMVAPTPLTVLDANGKLTDETKACIDLIAEADIILAGGHLHVSEQVPLFEEAKARGVRKMLINHPTYLIDCTDADMQSFASMGVYMEHSICMFVENSRAKLFGPADLKHLIDVVGPDRTVLGSDLGLTEAPLPVAGWREIVSMLLDLQVSEADIRKMVATNAARLLNLES